MMEDITLEDNNKINKKKEADISGMSYIRVVTVC